MTTKIISRHCLTSPESKGPWLENTALVENLLCKIQIYMSQTPQMKRVKQFLHWKFMQNNNIMKPSYCQISSIKQLINALPLNLSFNFLSTTKAHHRSCLALATRRSLNCWERIGTMAMRREFHQQEFTPSFLTLPKMLFNNYILKAAYKYIWEHGRLVTASSHKKNVSFSVKKLPNTEYVHSLSTCPTSLRN